VLYDAANAKAGHRRYRIALPQVLPSGPGPGGRRYRAGGQAPREYFLRELLSTLVDDYEFILLTVRRSLWLVT